MKKLVCMVLAAMTLMVPVVAFHNDSHNHSKTEAGNGLSSAIQVSGYWKVEVYNADGSLDKVREFHNGLVGASALPVLLNGEGVAGGLYIELGNSSQVGPCNNTNCTIAKNANIGITPNSTDLTVTNTGNNFETLSLAGSVTVSTTTTIDVVSSWVCLCNGQNENSTQCEASPDSCLVFTRRTLTQGVAVTAGQIVQVTVQITFS